MSKEFSLGRRKFLNTAAITIAAAGFGTFGIVNSITAMGKSLGALPNKSVLDSLGNASVWLNSAPLTANGLNGKVVLIQFWTYTCINWLRTLPYIRAWSEKYKDRGLVVIGIHAPEFSFEKVISNVRQAANFSQVTYPIAIDNDREIWDAFSNQFWPALYLVDGKGNIRHHQFGEGGYEESEKFIQLLLSEAGYKGTGHDYVSVNATDSQAAADWNNLVSPENYLGYGRTANFSTPVIFDREHNYNIPTKLLLNHWALEGDWVMTEEAVLLKKDNGKIVYRFHARDLHLVMGATPRSKPARFRVHIDGGPPNTAHGIDIDELGNGVVVEHRLYQLIRQPKPIVEHDFEIEFLDAGIEAYAFTFG